VSVLYVLSYKRDLLFSAMSFAYKNLYGSQPEDGFTKTAETCRCYDFVIIF